jgi:hypothetical protein
MPEFEIDGVIKQYVSGFFEADNLEEAKELAKKAFAIGDFMLGDTEVSVEEGKN